MLGYKGLSDTLVAFVKPVAPDKRSLKSGLAWTEGPCRLRRQLVGWYFNMGGRGVPWPGLQALHRRVSVPVTMQGVLGDTQGRRGVGVPASGLSRGDERGVAELKGRAGMMKACPGANPSRLEVSPDSLDDPTLPLSTDYLSDPGWNTSSAGAAPIVL